MSTDQDPSQKPDGPSDPDGPSGGQAIDTEPTETASSGTRWILAIVTAAVVVGIGVAIVTWAQGTGKPIESTEVSSADLGPLTPKPLDLDDIEEAVVEVLSTDAEFEASTVECDGQLMTVAEDSVQCRASNPRTVRPAIVRATVTNPWTGEYKLEVVSLPELVTDAQFAFLQALDREATPQMLSQGEKVCEAATSALTAGGTDLEQFIDYLSGSQTQSASSFSQPSGSSSFSQPDGISGTDVDVAQAALTHLCEPSLKAQLDNVASLRAAAAAAEEAETARIQAERDRGVRFDDGTHFLASGDVQPGTYAIERVSDCYWERTDANGEIIDNNFITGGRAQVTIRSTDHSFNSSGCGEWTPVG